MTMMLFLHPLVGMFAVIVVIFIGIHFTLVGRWWPCVVRRLWVMKVDLVDVMVVHLLSVGNHSVWMSRAAVDNAHRQSSVR